MPATHPFACNLCEAMCGMLVTVADDGHTVGDVRGDPDDVFSRGHICPKGPAMRDVYQDPDRVRFPLRRNKNTWERISWDEALAEAADRLRAIRQAHGKDAVAL